MKAKILTFSVILTILSVSDLLRAQGCSPGQTQLSNYVNDSTAPGGYIVTGYPTSCVNGSFVPICNSSSLTYFEAVTLCISQGQFGGYFESTPPDNLPSFAGNTSTVVIEFNCQSLLNCTDAVSMGTCPNGYAILSCPSPVCDADTYTPLLFNNYTIAEDGTTAITGIAQSCFAGRYVRFCNRPGTDHDAYANNFCLMLGYAFGRSLPANSSLLAGSPKGTGYLECSGSNCDSVVSSTHNECYRGNHDLVVQCIRARACEGTGLSFYRNVTTYSNGLEYVAGIVTNCLFNYTAVLCNNQPISPTTIQTVCSFLGFQGGTVVPFDYSLYGSAPLGSIYYTNYTCPSNATSSDECYADRSTDLSCYNGQNDVIVRCYRPAPTTLVPSMISTTSVINTATIPSTTTSGQVTNTMTPTVSNASLNVRLVAGVAVGAMVLILFIIILVVVILLFVYIVKTGSKGPLKRKKEPVELYKFSDVK